MATNRVGRACRVGHYERHHVPGEIVFVFRKPVFVDGDDHNGGSRTPKTGPRLAVVGVWNWAWNRDPGNVWFVRKTKERDERDCAPVEEMGSLRHDRQLSIIPACEWFLCPYLKSLPALR